MNDLLQRLSASGEKIGVTCRQVWEGNERDWHIEHFGLRLSARVVNEPDKLNGDATMLLLKALEAKGYVPFIACVRDAETGEILGYEIDLQGRTIDHPDGPCHAWCWEAPPAPTYFEAVLKATVEVVDGLK